MTEQPPIPPEGPLLRLARQAAGLSIPDAVRLSGVSKARWSQVESGRETRAGVTRAVQAKADTIARMARAVRLSPERLESEGGRPDAAGVLREMLQSEPPGAPALRPVPSAPHGSPAEEILADLLARYPGDKVVQAVGAQRGKAPRVIVAEILEWLDYLGQRDALPESGSSAGLPVVSLRKS